MQLDIFFSLFYEFTLLSVTFLDAYLNVYDTS